MNELDINKFNLIIDGQFGSTGKGLIGAYLSVENNPDIYVSNLSPNAGHTYTLYDGNPIVVKQLPVGSIINKRSMIYLTPGSIINPKLLVEEIEKFDIDPTRIFIHPRAAVIEDDDIRSEQDIDSSVSKIASTQSGVGEALSRKIMRKAKLACDVSNLQSYIKEIDLMNLMDMGCTVLMETSQGFDLGINHGFAYPYCTSRDVTVSTAMADAGVHPSYLGKVMMSIRTYPIRVGHLYNNDGYMIGNSGPFYPDSTELTWEELGEEPEKTTVTKKIRRIATFSEQQYSRSIYYIRPDWIFLNFANYVKSYSTIYHLTKMFKKYRIPTHIGFGPSIYNIYRTNSINYIESLLYTNMFECERERHGFLQRK